MTAVTVATEVQAVATVESLLNPIDQLFVLDRQQKSLAAQVKTLKDGIANSYELSEKDANGLNFYNIQKYVAKLYQETDETAAKKVVVQEETVEVKAKKVASK